MTHVPRFTDPQPRSLTAELADYDSYLEMRKLQMRKQRGTASADDLRRLDAIRQQRAASRREPFVARDPRAPLVERYRAAVRLRRKAAALEASLRRELEQAGIPLPRV